VSEPRLSLRLEVVAGNAVGTMIAVEDRLVFGRESEAGRLGDDPELSRHHAEISREPIGEYQIKDLASTNGTFVNRVRIDAAAVLGVGDLIDIGASSLIVREAPAAAPAETAVDVRAATVIVDLPDSLSAAEPDTATAEPEPEPTPRLELRIAFDFGQGEAEIGLADGSEPMRVRLEDGRWQLGDRNRE
jgi:hypothetical protein